MHVEDKVYVYVCVFSHFLVYVCACDLKDMFTQG